MVLFALGWMIVVVILFAIDLRETLRGTRTDQGRTARKVMRVLGFGLILFALVWLRPLYD